MLKVGAEVGVLGILPESRRRNRLTGTISVVESDAFEISVRQSFGNCPQYIQTRSLSILPEISTPQQQRPLRQSDRLEAADRDLIANADTLFVATSYVEASDAANQGADVSHRGGKPGFVKIENERSFVFPDFSGNYHFNTVGNILLNPKAGFLFIDFESKDLLYLTGTAKIVWQGEQVKNLIGAE